MLLSIYLIFCQFEPGVAYKSAAYKKNVQTYEKRQKQRSFYFNKFLYQIE